MKNIRNLKYFILAFTSFFVMAGCVSTHVTSKAISKNQPPIEQFILLVKTGQFQGNGGVGSGLGQRNLDSLVPHIASRLPAVFSLNNIPMKLESTVFRDSTLNGKAKVLIVKPVSASYSSRTGQTLTIRAEILDVNAQAYSWYADINMHTLGFGKFDEKVADDIAVKLLERLREDGLVSFAEGAPRVQ